LCVRVDIPNPDADFLLKRFVEKFPNLISLECEWANGRKFPNMAILNRLQCLKNLSISVTVQPGDSEFSALYGQLSNVREFEIKVFNCSWPFADVPISLVQGIGHLDIPNLVKFNLAVYCAWLTPVSLQLLLNAASTQYLRTMHEFQMEIPHLTNDNQKNEFVDIFSHFFGVCPKLEKIGFTGSSEFISFDNFRLFQSIPASLSDLTFYYHPLDFCHNYIFPILDKSQLTNLIQILIGIPNKKFDLSLPIKVENTAANNSAGQNRKIQILNIFANLPISDQINDLAAEENFAGLSISWTMAGDKKRRIRLK
jgi:hypothetical protein